VQLPPMLVAVLSFGFDVVYILKRKMSNVGGSTLNFIFLFSP
jgi:hypothetical protein